MIRSKPPDLKIIAATKTRTGVWNLSFGPAVKPAETYYLLDLFVNRVTLEGRVVLLDFEPSGGVPSVFGSGVPGG